MSRHDVLITVPELDAALESSAELVVLDVRWSLGGPTGDAAREIYRAGHVPGAQYIDLGTELAAPHPDHPERGRHPLPPARVIEGAARRLGLTRELPIVVYDDWNGYAAARAWWVLRWAGFRQVRVLDGGLSAWRSADGAIEIGNVTRQPSDVRVTVGALPTITADDAAQRPSRPNSALIDVRAAERYRGDAEPIDPRAGHIPGAVNAPGSGLLGNDGRLVPTGEILAWLRRATPVEAGSRASGVAVYCGSGVTAAHAVWALAAAGRTADLFPGSWSAWSHDPARPASLGDSP